MGNPSKTKVDMIHGFTRMILVYCADFVCCALAMYHFLPTRTRVSSS